MRIAEIEVISLYFAYPNRQGFRYAGGLVSSRVTSLVRVTTDDGLTGWGAAYSYPDLVRIIIEKHLKPLLLGDNPLEVEANWEKMYQLTRWYGRKGVAISALARISHQSRDKERVAGFGGERGRWIESWGALARVL